MSMLDEIVNYFAVMHTYDNIPNLLHLITILILYITQSGQQTVVRLI